MKFEISNENKYPFAWTADLVEGNFLGRIDIA